MLGPLFFAKMVENPFQGGKVKEPLASEYGYLRDDLLLFTYLHMAAAPELADAMLEAKTTGIAYENCP